MEPIFGHLCLCLGWGKWTVTLCSKPALCARAPWEQAAFISSGARFACPELLDSLAYGAKPSSPSPTSKPGSAQLPSTLSSAGLQVQMLTASPQRGFRQRWCTALLLPWLKNPAPCLSRATGHTPASSSLHVPYMWHPRALHPMTMAHAGAGGDHAWGDAAGEGSWATPGGFLGEPRCEAGTELRAAGGCCRCRD